MRTCARLHAHPLHFRVRISRWTLCSAQTSDVVHSKVIGRREIIALVAAGLYFAVPTTSFALPRGGIDARVAAAFNTAFAAGGDPVVRLTTHPLCCAIHVRDSIRHKPASIHQFFIVVIWHVLYYWPTVTPRSPHCILTQLPWAQCVLQSRPTQLCTL